MAATRAVLQMKTQIKGKPWIGRCSVVAVDDMIEKMLPTAFEADEVGDTYSPVDVVQLIKDRAGTQVLATVYLTSWRESWALGVTALILTSCREHSMLKFLAVKGGPGCDGEIDFLCNLMKELGFKETHPPEVHADGLRNWDWSIDRKTRNGGFTNYVVSLTQYPDLSRAFALPQTFAVRKSEAHAPNLRKCAVISCPVFDKDGNEINEELNRMIVNALDQSMERARTKGYLPEAHWAASEEANAAYQEFFDLPRKTLAELGIKH